MVDFGPALDAGKSVVEDTMLDTCRLLRPADSDVAVLDESTGKLVAPDDTVLDDQVLADGGPPLTLVYEGACSVREKGDTRVYDEAGEEIADASHVLSLPLEAPEPFHGDVVRVVVSQRDFLLAGRVFDVRGLASGKTFAVSRKIGLSLRRRVDR